MSANPKINGPFAELTVPDIRFYASHGEYAEEALVGGYFSVTVSLKYPVVDNKKNDWINYEKILGWVTDEMSGKKNWIEDLAKSIYTRLKAEISGHTLIRVKVVKEHPPLKGLKNVQFVLSDY